jgi:hypothetical protein
MPNWSTEHWHARNRKPAGPCEECGKPKAEVHHVNGNWHDHAPENLKRLCRSCHNLAHQRRKSCRICGMPQRGLGLCNKHYIRFKKWGDPLATKVNQNTPVRYDDSRPKNVSD